MNFEEYIQSVKSVKRYYNIQFKEGNKDIAFLVRVMNKRIYNNVISILSRIVIVNYPLFTDMIRNYS